MPGDGAAAWPDGGDAASAAGVSSSTLAQLAINQRNNECGDIAHSFCRYMRTHRTRFDTPRVTFPCRLWDQSAGTQCREGDHVADRRAVGQEHDQPVDADA